MPYENFPYADLHNLNLDWLLKQVKEMKAKMDQIDIPQLVSDKIDEMVDDGTMDQIINQNLFDQLDNDIHTLANDQWTQGLAIKSLKHQTASATVAMLACPAANTLDSSRGYSLCVVIHNNEFCVVYDMGNDNAATLLTYLAQSGISKVDAFIISHYHNDHVQVAGVSAVCGAVDVTKWYLPHGAINWGSYIGSPDYSSVESSVKAAITAGSDTWEEPAAEGQTLLLANMDMFNTIKEACKIEFYNLDPSYFVSYYSYQRDEDNDPITHTNYNNFSMCCRVTVGGKVLVLTGDIELPAQENMAKIVGGADILQIPHHGLDLIDDEGFRSAMTGKIFLTAAYGLARVNRLTIAANLMLQRARQLGCSVSTVSDSTILCQFGGQGCYLVPNNMGTVTPSAGFGDNIPSGADLDDYETIGFVGFVKNATAASNISNVPEASAGELRVLACNQNSNTDSTGAIRQEYTLIFSYAHPYVYVRWKYEGTWTAWKGYEAT